RTGPLSRLGSTDSSPRLIASRISRLLILDDAEFGDRRTCASSCLRCWLASFVVRGADIGWRLGATSRRFGVGRPFGVLPGRTDSSTSTAGVGSGSGLDRRNRLTPRGYGVAREPVRSAADGRRVGPIVNQS